MSDRIYRDSSVIKSRLSALAVAAIAGCIALASSRTEAQWWRSASKDFEDCADRAEKAKSKEEKTSQLADCNAKFAGRRKTGGGYTYYDFMQDRSFDIAGPNPTAEEQKKIDQQYTAYLDGQRRDNIANAFAAKQQQEELQPALQPAPQPALQPAPQAMQKVSLRTDAERVPVPVASPVKQAARIKAAHCAKNAFSCEWPLLSQGLDDLKRLFSPSPPAAKAKRS
jgi:hypothetical protein